MKTIIQTGTILVMALGVLVAGNALAQPALPTAPAGQTLDAWTFAGTNFLSFRHSAPISFTNVAPVPTWDGNGLQVDATNAAWIVYPAVQTNGHVELSCSHGSAEVWLSLDWNSSDGLGDWGTVLEVGNWNTNLSGATGAWGLYISPDGGCLCFSAQTNGASTNYLTAPISWNAGEWHQIVLTYSATNSALYLEGQLVTNGPGLSIIPGANVLSNGFSIGSDGLTGLQQSRSIFNQLITYNYQLDADTISNNYAYDTSFVYPLPSDGGGLRSIGGLQTDSAPSLPPGPPGGGGTNSGGGPIFNSPSYSASDFWIEPLPLVTNGFNDGSLLTLLVHATTNNSTYAPVYELLWTDNLTPPINWSVMQTFLGATNTNVTVLTVPIFPDEPMGFFQAVNLGTNGDSAGNGLPDSWQRQYFGTVGVDPFGNPMGDGYDNLYKYQHGMNPNTFYTPASPTGVSAILNTNGNVIISWPASANLPNTGAGAVTGYTLQVKNDGSTNFVNLGSNSLSYATNLASDLLLQDYLFFPDYTPFVTGYALRVNYAHTNSLWSGLEVSFDPTCSVNAAVARGTGGALYLTASAVPSNIVALRVVTQSYATTYPINTYASDGPGFNDFGDVESFSPDFQSSTNSSWPVPYFDVPVSSLSNGIYQIRPSKAPLFGLYSFTVMGIGANGNLGIPVIASPTNEWDQAFYVAYFGPHTPNVPFFDGRTNIAQNINMFLRGANGQQPFTLGLDRLNNSGNMAWSYTIAEQTNYVWDGFCFQNQRNEFEPFEETTLFTNLIFNLDLFDASGNFTNPLSVNFSLDWELDLQDPTKLFDAYKYVTNNPNFPLGPLPSSVLDQTTENWICSLGSTADDFVWNGGNSFTIPSTLKNIYGLPFQNFKYLRSDDTWSTASPGSTISVGNFNFGQEVAAPILNTIGYYFARPLIDPLPGQSTFSVTNGTPSPLVIPFGKQSFITAWAKQSISNGYSSVYAFPQQYFDKAFLADTNGNITTNQTGILSEYGDFFPTQPGKVFLTTKPDAATSSVGTNVLNVIKLQVDANHDGTMDLRFAGPDNTSTDRPFVFWVNNDSDVPTKQFPAGEDTSDLNNPDYLKQNIPSERDLEDWARLWICGLPALPTNCQVTLSWNVISGNPAINLVKPVETNGGIGYLTNADIAAEQAAGSGAFVPSYKFTTNISSTSPYTFLPGALTNGNNFLLFEGAKPGKGELVLTISQNETNLVSTSVFIDLHDVKDFYERAIIATNGSGGDITNITASLLKVEPATVSRAGEDTNVIIYAHGADNTVESWLSFSDTIFKRLYWSGYQGRFATVHWPSPPLNFENVGFEWFNKTEFIGYKSAVLLKNYTVALQNRFPADNLHMWVHSAGGFIGSEALNEGAPFTTLILSSTSVSASCFDVNAPTNSDLLAREASQRTPEWQPWGYHGVYTNITSRVVNYFNTNDDLLNKDWLAKDQLHLKPTPNYNYDGTNSSFLLVINRVIISDYQVTDPQESRAMVSRSRTAAIGAVGPSLGQTRQGVISSAVDIRAKFGLGNTDPEHGDFL